MLVYVLLPLPISDTYGLLLTYFKADLYLEDTLPPVIGLIMFSSISSFVMPMKLFFFVVNLGAVAYVT
jgi:hypothetical protein